MAIKFLHDLDVEGNLDLNDNQALNLVVQHLATNPTAVEGKIYYNTSNDVLMVCLGSTWTELSSAVGDITSVVAGAGMTGGGASGDATLNVIGGTGITANANDIALTAGLIADGSNITSVGTIGTGVWEGTTIKTAYIGDDQVTEDKLANTLLAEIDANTAKNTNVTTNLGITGSAAARVITSSDGTNVTVPVATTSVSGVMSAAQVTTLNGKANTASPTLTGVPAAPTAAANTNTTQIATTAYVQTELTDLIGGAPGALDTLNELAAAIGDDASYASSITTALGLKAPIASPTFTGTVGGITKAMVGLGNVANIAVSGTNTGDEPDSSTTVKGIVERATDAEALTGTDTTRYVTPKHLANRTFSTQIGDGSATTITVTHNLGSAAIVSLYDTQYRTVYTDVTVPSANTAVLRFNTAPANNAYVVLCTKI